MEGERQGFVEGRRPYIQEYNLSSAKNRCRDGRVGRVLARDNHRGASMSFSPKYRTERGVGVGNTVV